MLDRFLNYIKKHALITCEEKVLLAVSGGIDSMVLLHLFSRSTTSFAVAHCNFQLRGQESDADEQLVRQASEKLGVKIFVKNFDTKDHAKHHGVSTQMAARELRFAWFRELCNSKGYGKVVLAHHLNDSIETFFLNLSRGTSLKGLRGIQSKNNDLIRPLLDFTKEEIRSYALENNLNWREDSSNQETLYKRNLIRHQVIPEFLKLNPDFESVMKSNLEKLNARYKTSEENYEMLRSELLIKKGRQWLINKNALASNIRSSYDLYEILREQHFNFDTCVQLYQSLDKVGGRFKSSDFIIYSDREELIIEKREQEKDVASEKIFLEQDSMIINGNKYLLRKVSQKAWVLNTSPDHGMFDLGKLHFPLTIRPWEEGDKLQPLGMKGHKLVSDLLIDEKVPIAEKKKVLVLISNGKVVWVIGYRIADWAKVSDATETVYQINRT